MIWITNLRVAEDKVQLIAVEGENAIIGKRIKFSVDEKGAMAWFDSVDGPANELN